MSKLLENLNLKFTEILSQCSVEQLKKWLDEYEKRIRFAPEEKSPIGEIKTGELLYGVFVGETEHRFFVVEKIINNKTNFLIFVDSENKHCIQNNARRATSEEYRNWKTLQKVFGYCDYHTDKNGYPLFDGDVVNWSGYTGFLDNVHQQEGVIILENGEWEYRVDLKDIQKCEVFENFGSPHFNVVLNILNECLHSKKTVTLSKTSENEILIYTENDGKYRNVVVDEDGDVSVILIGYPEESGRTFFKKDLFDYKEIISFL